MRHGLPDRVGERRVHGVGAVRVVDRDEAAGAGRKGGVELLADPALDPVLGELPDRGAGGRPDRGRGEQRRCEQADDESRAAADLGALASR